MAGKRKSISKKLRFEIFKRDQFTCQYCGKNPPNAVLEIDHIEPVSKGGTNDEDNLLTSCFDCNRGKSDTELGDVKAVPIARKIERQREIQEQLSEYNDFLLEVREYENQLIDEIGQYWYNKTAKPEDIDRYVFNEERATSVRNFVKRLPAVEIYDAIDIAFSQIKPNGYGVRDTFKYFCGICWNKIRNGQEEE